MTSAQARASPSCSRSIARVVKGKDEVIQLALITLLARGHLLIEDVPGVGKTTLAQALARSFHCSFQRIQFTSDLLPSDVIGISVFNPVAQGFEFKPGPIFANIIVADEINRTTPKTQSALLEAMNEAQVTVDNHTHALPQAVHGAGHAESHRASRHLPAAGIAARPLPDAHPHGLSRRARAKRKSCRNNCRRTRRCDAITPVMDAADVVAMQETVSQRERGR